MNVGDQTFSIGNSSIFDADPSINPTVNSITPKTALPVFGGVDITITGTNLKNGDKETSVIIGDDYCQIKSLTDNQIVCTIPGSGAGQTALIVEVEGIGASKIHRVQYGLSVISLNPSSGSLVGGTKLSIKGTGFGTNSSEVKVQLGENYNCHVSSVSNTEIECETEGASSTVILDNSGIHYGNEFLFCFCFSLCIFRVNY